MSYCSLRGLGLLLACGALVSCAGLLGADGEYEETGASTTTAHTGAGGAGGGGGGAGGTTSTGTSTTSTGTGGGTTSTGTSTTSTGTGTGGGTTSTATTTTSTATTTTSTTTTTTTSSTSTTSTSTSTTTTTTAQPVSWRRYSFDMTSGTWSSAALSSVWTGINAPPKTGIIAATHLDHFDKLLVIADNGMFYVQEGSVWRTPVSMSVRFPEITSPTTVAVLGHVPGGWNEVPPPQPLVEELTFLDNPLVDYFHYYANNTASHTEHIVISVDGTPPAPPQMTGRAQWAFEIWNKSQIGYADGFSMWQSYGDGYLYKFTASFEWTRYPVEGGPIWAGKPNAPDWATLEAAYFVSNAAYDGKGIIVFIGP